MLKLVKTEDNSSKVIKLLDKNAEKALAKLYGVNAEDILKTVNNL